MTTVAPQYTRCPKCRTTFRVTPQQLMLRDGQVRCGRCRTVFNAYAALYNFKGRRIPGPGMEVQTDTMTLRDFVDAAQEDFTVIKRPPTASEVQASLNEEKTDSRRAAKEAAREGSVYDETAEIRQAIATRRAESAAKAAARAAVATANAGASTTSDIHYGIQPIDQQPPSSRYSVTYPIQTDTHPSALLHKQPITTTAPTTVPPISRSPFTEPGNNDTPSVPNSANKVPTTAPRSTPSSNKDEAVVDADKAQAQAARRKKKKRTTKEKGEETDAKPSLSLVLNAKKPTWVERLGGPRWLATIFNIVAVLALSGLFIAQGFWFCGDTLAYQQPWLKPVLTSGCKLLDCTIKPYRDNALVREISPQRVLFIEGSDLLTGNGADQRLTLSATLRNRGNGTLAFPDLQFELRDELDHPVVRRFFTPEEYLADPSRINEGLAGGTDIVVQIVMQSAAVNANGYRLDLVYR